jgi:soluble lytic murein transglycosylase
VLRAIWVIPLTILFLVPSTTPVEAQDPSSKMVLMPPGAPGPAFPMSEELKTAIADREHATAADLLRAIPLKDIPGPAVGDHAFVLAWSLIRAKRNQEAIPLLARIQTAKLVPKDYLGLTIAEIHLAAGEPIKAAQSLASLSEDSLLHSRAALVRAKSFQKAGRTRDAQEIYESLARRPDPVEGSALALWALAKKKGLASPAAKNILIRLWSHYPNSAEGAAAKKQLDASNFTPSSGHLVGRATAFNKAGAWRSTMKLLEPRLSSFASPSSENCSLTYLLGRAYFKKNEVSKAAAILGPMGRNCVQHAPDLGPKMLYLAGKSEERKKGWSNAASHYLAIPKLYPGSSYADDGFALGGIAIQETGNATDARKHWENQVARYPAGDMAGEAFWRLAWGAYRSGNTKSAINWAERTLRELPIAVDPGHFRAARYWAARWRLYPSVKAPNQLTQNDKDKAQGLDELTAVMVNHPTSYYGLQAASRLRSLDPNRLLALRHLARPSHPKAWQFRTEFVEDQRTLNGIALSRLGLRQEALAEFRRINQENLLAEEATYLAVVRWAVGDVLGSHDYLRTYLQSHPPEQIGAFRGEILRQAYPQRFFPEVKAATVDYDWDPRIFHALVREESNFNPKIVSWAGARGLSQLMPRTAKQVAGWVKVPYSKARLFEPAYNLRIGSRYFHFLMERYKNNPFMSMAGYNAGEGNVGKWRKRFGDLPTDEWVEMIPIRQTRHYVKRVAGTWQTYHYLYDGGPPMTDLSAFNKDIVPN